jgi:hypothetical protein
MIPWIDYLINGRLTIIKGQMPQSLPFTIVFLVLFGQILMFLGCLYVFGHDAFERIECDGTDLHYYNWRNRRVLSVSYDGISCVRPGTLAMLIPVKFIVTTAGTICVTPALDGYQDLDVATLRFEAA